MGSLCAGPRTLFPYTEDTLDVGLTFYVAVYWGNDRPLESTIVKVVDVNKDKGMIYVEDSEWRQWEFPIPEFIRVANLYTDLHGNSRYTKKNKWWRFWR